MQNFWKTRPVLVWLSNINVFALKEEFARKQILTRTSSLLPSHQTNDKFGGRKICDSIHPITPLNNQAHPMNMQEPLLALRNNIYNNMNFKV